MDDKDQEQISLDILHHMEDLTEQVNDMMVTTTKPAFRRYPLTFAILVLFGVVAVTEGAKGVLEEFSPFANHPWYMLITGLFVLVITGTLYKKLNKEK